MRTIDRVNIAQAYIEGMLWAAFGVRIFSENVAEWHIEAVKKYAKKLKEEEVEHSALTAAEKDEQKRLWKRWIDETTNGFKEELKNEGRMLDGEMFI
jgi:uncharacterized protein YnzC (UPF0291/DUF896 family)